MDQEIWIDIVGWEGLYQVSNHGRVKSYDRILRSGRSTSGLRLRKGVILSQWLDSRGKGYYNVSLSKDYKLIRYCVHRLVAMAFLPNPNNLPQVNHKDENPQNNHVSNLEWCTHKYNINYGTAMQRSGEKRRKPILQLDRETMTIIGKFNSIKEAAEQLNINYASLKNCLRKVNGQETSGGFKWRFV